MTQIGLRFNEEGGCFEDEFYLYKEQYPNLKAKELIEEIIRDKYAFERKAEELEKQLGQLKKTANKETLLETIEDNTGLILDVLNTMCMDLGVTDICNHRLLPSRTVRNLAETRARFPEEVRGDYKEEAKPRRVFS